MDVEVAAWLVSDDAHDAIELAESFDDPSSLQAATALRRTLPSEKASAVADLVACRRRGVRKLGDLAGSLFLTRDSLEQATRWEVAQWRAGRLVDCGVRALTDAGCGVGIDSLGFLSAGGNVVGFERDPILAIFAEANLRHHTRTTSITMACVDSGPCDLAQGDGRVGAHSDDVAPSYEVRTTDLTMSTDWIPTEDHHALFLDPARRTARGRSWDVDDLSPSWSFVESLLPQVPGGLVVKLAPGFPRHLLPQDSQVTWVSHRGTLVETTLWSGFNEDGRREVVVLTSDLPGMTVRAFSLFVGGGTLPSPGAIGEFVYEPDAAVIRAGGIAEVARMTDSHLIAAGIAYLSGDRLVRTPFATPFQVHETFDYTEKNLKEWVRTHQIGTLEIKVRGLDIDPAVLRRKLKLSGLHSATIILTPTTQRTQALVVSRVESGEAV